MESTAATAALEGRYAALSASASTLSSEELLDVIESAQREKDAASARQAVALAHLSALDSHVQEDGTSVEVHHGLGYQRLDAPELAAPRLGCSVHVATNRVLDAIRQLTRTPAVVDAMAAGELDEQRARVVTEETEFLCPQSAAEVVDRVKDVWGQLTTGPLRRLLARTAAQVDPDAVTAHAQDERARRGLTRRTGVHGTDHWRGDFKVEQARTAWAAVTERARQLVRDKQADSLELARADAVMELILEHSDVKVVVHITRAADDEASASDSGNAAAEDLVEVGGLGAPGTTFVNRDWLQAARTSDPDRDLTCDPGTGALVHGDVPAAFARGQDSARRAHRAAERSGTNVVDFSESYRVPDPMARLIRLRDGSCRFPGCATPARQCDLDHVRPWPAGPTTPTNLMCLCRRHHRIKQRDGWTVQLHPDATVTWTDPTGLSTTTWPVDHLHLVTAGHTPRDPKTLGRAATDPADISTTFEEELIELLGGPDNAAPRAYPVSFDIDGNIYGGAPPRLDLDHSPGWSGYEVDFPPRPPRPPEPIPF
ncbi:MULTISPECIES: HNH endonuclease signature motif containing protein [unclassified Knoellia]|uniref:HNH endonuclease signature motif containing protein n=1 Tax=Knoellia altitudinis TaxID=3404795 RepID=UPI00360E139A